jgi:hypothetical protein
VSFAGFAGNRFKELREAFRAKKGSAGGADDGED